jgi:hypothetical protein
LDGSKAKIRLGSRKNCCVPAGRWNQPFVKRPKFEIDCRLECYRYRHGLVPVDADFSITPGSSESYSGLTTLDDSRNVWDSANTATALNTATAPYVSYTINFGSASVTGAEFFLNGLAENDTDGTTGTKLQLSYSVDNYESSLGNLTQLGYNSVNDPYGYENYIASIPGTLSGTVTFKVFFYNTSALFAANVATYANVFMGGDGASFETASGTYDPSMGNYSAGLVAVPEPTSLALVGVGAGALLLRRRKK